jgi:Enoyl-(Acyl carrier protein) reductase
MTGRRSRLKLRMQGEHSTDEPTQGITTSLGSARTGDLERGCRNRQEGCWRCRGDLGTQRNAAAWSGQLRKEAAKGSDTIVRKRQYPIWDRRLGVPMDIAKGILFLACDDAGCMNGAGLIVDGGLTATWRIRVFAAPNEPTHRQPRPDRIGQQPNECSAVQQAESLAGAVTLCGPPERTIEFTHRPQGPLHCGRLEDSIAFFEVLGLRESTAVRTRRAAAPTCPRRTRRRSGSLGTHLELGSRAFRRRPQFRASGLRRGQHPQRLHRPRRYHQPPAA